MIDSEYKSLYRFKSDVNQDNNFYFSSIKILKYEYKKNGFVNKNNSKKSDDEIVIVKKQPIETNYYEFESYERPEILTNIDMLKINSIKDISKNTGVAREIWGNYKYSVIFIENKNCNYILWKMKPLYLE